jgi:hypothetical protein
MINLGFDFVFLAGHTEYRVICTIGSLPLVFSGFDTR